mmetsp:Transcript_28694/g.91517  ORF Transcript_28694/g.91517 Transcript_28694/m.91517 type:complete len:221 (-) Transcript_28694:1358-2020(-)
MLRGRQRAGAHHQVEVVHKRVPRDSVPRGVGPHQRHPQLPPRLLHGEAHLVQRPRPRELALLVPHLLERPAARGEGQRPSEVRASVSLAVRGREVHRKALHREPIEWVGAVEQHGLDESAAGLYGRGAALDHGRVVPLLEVLPHQRGRPCDDGRGHRSPAQPRGAAVVGVQPLVRARRADVLSGRQDVGLETAVGGGPDGAECGHVVPSVLGRRRRRDDR